MITEIFLALFSYTERRLFPINFEIAEKAPICLIAIYVRHISKVLEAFLCSYNTYIMYTRFFVYNKFSAKKNLTVS